MFCAHITLFAYDILLLAFAGATAGPIDFLGVHNTMADIQTYRLAIGRMPAILTKITQRKAARVVSAHQECEYNFNNGDVQHHIGEGLFVVCITLCAVIAALQLEHITWQKIDGWMFNFVQLDICGHAHDLVMMSINMCTYTFAFVLLIHRVSILLGCVQCIGLLLLLGGIEPNPGPTNWEAIQTTFARCTTFAELYKTVRHVPIQPINGLKGNHMQLSYQCDIVSKSLRPRDCMISEDEFYPIQTQAIGNCLPCALSTLVYGDELHATEMRVRLVYEGIMNSQLYLSDDYLNRGLTHPFRQTNIASRYATYSGSYICGADYRQEETVRATYEHEMVQVSRNTAWCGIWQLHQAANVVKCPVFSIYPDTAAFTIRGDLNRLILPHDDPKQTTVYIMWTQASALTSNINHFVPVIRYVAELFMIYLCTITAFIARNNYVI